MLSIRSTAIAISLLCLLKANGFTISFDSDPLGNLSSSDWSEKSAASPSTQSNLFQVEASNGFNGTKGLALNAALVESSYRAGYKTGLIGNSYTVSCKVRISIDGSVPSQANHSILGVSFSTSPDWNDGSKYRFYLNRRSNGTQFGVTGTGISAAQPEDWHSIGGTNNSEFGLPNTLPAGTATSDWFTMSLTITQAAAGTWDTLAQVVNENTSQTIVSHSVDGITLPSGFTPGATLYARIAVPWVNSGSFLVLEQGHVDALDIDDFTFDAAAPPLPTGLPVHGLTSTPSTQDLDGSGLPDLWEALYKAHDLDPLADSDGDSVINADEAVSGTDPFDPQSAFKASILSNLNVLAWPRLAHRPGSAQSSTDLGGSDPWGSHPGTPVASGDEWHLSLPLDQPARFFRIQSTEDDLDSDGVPDWLEPLIGFSNGPGDSESAGLPISYDTNNDNLPDITLSGDLSAFNEIYRQSEPGTRMTRAQAARLLIQSTFGPATIAEVDHAASIGPEAWIEEQIALPASHLKPYILDIKEDWRNGSNDPDLDGYASNDSIVFGVNVTTPWARIATSAPDQLRQRVAWALSQIVVTSRGAAMLANQPEAITHYYDALIDHAFGDYEELLLEASLSPVMGHYLSHLGNRKADPSIGRYPDENYAREIMQLFTIGLWELNPDGTQKTDESGNPIPTYGNPEITELSRVFTGIHYNSGNFGGGWRDDGTYMTTPMKVFASEHDFGPKSVVTGDGTTHTIPSRSASDANALQDVKDAVHQLVNHPNTAPFISRQLIQFLVTSNPSTAYVEEVAAVFSDNGSGKSGDLEAVVKAILLNDEARDPMQHLGTPHFGQLREPTIRTMHLARILNLGRHDDLTWWDWGNYKDESLQDPMHAPTVFNYFRPDYRLFGELASNQLDSPAFGITDSYSSISFPNRLWSICNTGFNSPNGNSADSEDLSALVALASNVPALLDHLSLLYCAGTLGAESRDSISTALLSESSLTERARLAAYLVLVSPEGSCLK